MDKYRASARASGLRRACVTGAIVMLSGVVAAQARTIQIVSGTYGANCKAPGGNATRDLMRQCNGRDTCEYTLNRQRINDSKRACRRDLQADWRCTDTEFHTAMLSPEAGVNSTLVLSCVEQNGPGH